MDECRSIPGLLLGVLTLRREAIREVAGRPECLAWGVGFCVLAALARIYNLEPIGASPRQALAPLAGIVVISLLLHGVGSVRTRREQPRPKYGAFLRVYLFAAPIAFLYALPVENALDSLEATKANLALLGIVALWRVAILVQIYRALFGLGALEAFARMLLAASILLGAAGFSEGFMAGVAHGMGGISDPVEILTIGVFGKVFCGSVVAFPVALLLLALAGFLTSDSPPPAGAVPRPTTGRWKWADAVFACLLAGAFVPLVAWGQRGVARVHEARDLVLEGRVGEAVDSLETWGPWGIGDPAPVTSIAGREDVPATIRADLFRRVVVDRDSRLPRRLKLRTAQKMAGGLDEWAWTSIEAPLREVFLQLARAERANYELYRYLDEGERPLSAIFATALFRASEPEGAEDDGELDELRRWFESEHPSRAVRADLERKKGH